MTAIRIARAHTGRERVVKFAGAYHGHSDGLLAVAGSGLATAGIPASPGVPAAVAAATAVVAWNDPEALVAATSDAPVAAIIAEPLPANMGLVPAAEGFLEFVRARADECGAVLIFDEVISGFRVARGGASERTGVTPDLLVLGKIIGGGLPGGRGRRAAGAARAARPGRRDLPGGHALGKPARGRRRPRDPRAARRRRIRHARAADGSARSRAARGGGRAPGERRVGPRPADGVLLDAPAARPPRRAALRHRRPTGPGAASCWRAASIRRPRSSRPGSPRWRTGRPRSSGRSRRPADAFAAIDGCPPSRGAGRR